ncbi:MAG: molybdate ABC transporter permease subunit, partial [Sphingomonadales bacterium]
MTEFETEALLLSLKVGATAISFALPLAIFLGWLLAKRDFRGKLILDILIHTPMVLPPVVVGFALLSLFGRTGLIGAWLHSQFGIDIAFTWQAAAIAAGIMALPLMVRSIRLSMESIEPRLEQLAATLGASPSRVFRTITLPLARPGILAATVIGFARALGEFGATIAFAANIPGVTQTLPLAVYTTLQSPGGEDAATRLALIALAIAVTALV